MGCATSGRSAPPPARAASAANRSRLPTATGGMPLRPTTHSPSHWISWGHTRPHTAGRLFFSQIFRMAPLKSPSRMSPMKAGMSTPTGHPFTQFGFRHCRQRAASSRAISGV